MADIYAEMDRVGSELGRPYYKIPCGGSNALGALGYVDCVREIRDQGFKFDHMIWCGRAAAALWLVWRWAQSSTCLICV